RRHCASGIAKTARGHGPDRQGRRPARAVVTGAAEGARWNGEPADAAAQPAIRQGARDPRRRRAVEADNRRPAGETRGADRLTFASRDHEPPAWCPRLMQQSSLKQTKSRVEEK